MPADVLEGLSVCAAVATDLKIALAPIRKKPHHSKASVNISPYSSWEVSAALGHVDIYLLSITTKHCP